MFRDARGYQLGMIAGCFVSPHPKQPTAHKRTARSSRRFVAVLLASSALAGYVPTAANAQQVVQNSSFESVSNPGSTANTFCTAAFWTTVGACNAAYQYNTAANVVPPTGNMSINLTIQNSVSLSQAVNITTPGKYTFAFQYILVGGTHTANANVGTNTFLLNQAQASWTAFTSTVTLASGATNVSFTSTPGGIANFALDDVTLTFLRYTTLSPQLPANTPSNISRVATAIDTFTNSGGTLPTGFGGLYNLSGAPLATTLQQLTGESGASGGAQSGIELTNSFLSLLVNGFLAGRDDFGGFGPSASGYAADRARADKRWTIWGSAYGGSATANGNATTGSNDTRVNNYGFATGLDYRVSADTMVGFALAGAGTNWSINNGFGDGKSDAFQTGIYGSRQFGASYVSAAASYGWFNMNTNRTVTVSGTDTLTASFNASDIAGRLETGHRFAAPMDWGVTPYTALQVQAFILPSYSESASSGSNQFALSYASRTATATRGEFGAWFDTSKVIGATDVKLFSRLAYAHDWNSDPNVNASFQTLVGSSFIVSGATTPKNLALVATGAKMKLSRDVSLSAKFDGEFSGGYHSYAGTGTLRYVWN